MRSRQCRGILGRGTSVTFPTSTRGSCTRSAQTGRRVLRLTTHLRRLITMLRGASQTRKRRGMGYASKRWVAALRRWGMFVLRRAGQTTRRGLGATLLRTSLGGAFVCTRNSGWTAHLYGFSYLCFVLRVKCICTLPFSYRRVGVNFSASVVLRGLNLRSLTTPLFSVWCSFLGLSRFDDIPESRK